MKKLFLTSWIGGYDRSDEDKTPIKLNNTNRFVDRLRLACPNIRVITYIASDPNDFEKCDEHSKRLMANLKLDGFEPEAIYVIDNRNRYNVADAIMSSDIVFLSGGHVPTQNAFFKKIALKEILQNYNGVVIGQSAGSMNCAELVYVQPEEPEDFADKDFKIQIAGLGLTKYNIMPHINFAKDYDYNGVTVYDMCMEDCKKIYHYGIVDGGFIEVESGGRSAVSYGETYLFREGACHKLCDNGESIEVNIWYKH